MQVPGLNLLVANEPTDVLCLMNMVSADELQDDEEYDGTSNMLMTFIFISI